MFNVDDFFIILKFYDDNKDVITAEGTPQSNEIIYSEETKNLDQIVIQTAIDSKQKTVLYFQNILDLEAFKTADYQRLRRFLIDWHATNRTFIQLNKNSSNPFSMDSAVLDQAIKSFGFDYSYLISDKKTKALFLLSLVNLYKMKGSPLCLSDALKFFGFSNTALYEWWIVRISDELYFEGKIIDTGEDFLKEFPKTRYITWDTFEELKDSHWMYTRDQILNLDKSEERFIGLPSLTPYFSITNFQELDSINSAISILSRLLSDQFNNFLTTSGQPPKDILYDIATFKISLLELYLGLLYCYWKYNDWMKYSALLNYISNEFNLNPELDYLPFVYSQPYAYEKLLFWTSIRKDILGNHQPLDLAASGNPDAIQPISGKPFNPYPPQMEYWTSDNQPDLSSGFSDLDLNYDNSLIRYDDGVFYPVLTNLPPFPPNARYLHADSTSIPNYTIEFEKIPEFPPAIEETLTRFFEVTARPSSRSDCKNKLQQYIDEFTRLQSLNFTLNTQDPQRILDGISPVETTADLASITAVAGDTVLVRKAPTSPAVYEYNGTSWSVMPNGLRDGKLGLSPTFKQWIDTQVGSDNSNYIVIAEQLLEELDVFISTYLQQTQVRLTFLLLGIDIQSQLDPIVNFFKPAKSRLLTFEMLYKFNQQSENSINVEDSADIEHVDVNLPEEMPETIRGNFPQNFDEYDWGFDAPEVFDDVDISVYEDDGFGELVLIPKEEWAM
jgi:hypothetical protein